MRKKEINEFADVITQNIKRGVKLTVENRDKRDYYLYFDFSGSKNLALKPIGTTKKGNSDMKCLVLALGSGKLTEACELVIPESIKDENCEVTYSVICKFRNEITGNLEPISNPTPAEENFIINENINLICVAAPYGYMCFLRNEGSEVRVTLNFGESSPNVSIEPIPGSQTKEPAPRSASVKIPPGELRMPFIKILFKDTKQRSFKYKSMITFSTSKEIPLEVKRTKSLMEPPAATKLEATKSLPVITRMCNLCGITFMPAEKVVEYKVFHLHQECYDKALKCEICNELIIGNYTYAKGISGKENHQMHNSCIPVYKEKTRPTCVKCNKIIMDNKWYTSSEGLNSHFGCNK